MKLVTQGTYIGWQGEDAGTCRTEKEKYVRTSGGNLMRQTCRQSGIPARLHPLRNSRISSGLLAFLSRNDRAGFLLLLLFVRATTCVKDTHPVNETEVREDQMTPSGCCPRKRRRSHAAQVQSLIHPLDSVALAAMRLAVLAPSHPRLGIARKTNERHH